MRADSIQNLKSLKIASDSRTHHIIVRSLYIFVYIFPFFFVLCVVRLRDIRWLKRRFDSINTYNRLHNVLADSDLNYGGIHKSQPFI